MLTYDIIAKKRDGGSLSAEEIAFLVDGFTKGDVPDYQMAAFLMAVYLRGMNDAETAALTHCMAHSGDVVDLSPIGGLTADKHSTGGVGDKTTLICAPIVAACGVNIAKMSGRGLGHTGGTVDKLESIPGLRTELSEREFFEQVKSIGIAVVGQSGNLAPADKKIYALRDVTATVESLPLIASSIMSKKLAAGSRSILLDVKYGSGAFMHTAQDAIKLASAMVAIGEHNGRRTAALITSMDVPLGFCVGNSLEVSEAVQTLRGNGPADLTQLCLELAANMLILCDKGDYDTCLALAKQALFSGSAFEKLCQMVTAQGGDAAVLKDPSLFKKPAVCHTVYAKSSGYIGGMDTGLVGTCALLLGAGRRTKEDVIDHSAGIVLLKKTGDALSEGDAIARLYTCDKQRAAEGEAALLNAVHITQEKPNVPPLIHALSDKNGTHLHGV